MLTRFSADPDRWQIAAGGSIDARAVRLTLAADSAVRGWTRRSLPVLIVTCRAQQEPLVALATGLAIEVERTVTRSVLVQVGDEPARVAQWILGDDHQTLVAPAPDARILVSRLRSASHLEMGFVPLRSDPVVARFSAAGFARRWDRTRECGDDKLSNIVTGQ